MLYEIARARQHELLGDGMRLAAQVALEQATKLDRLQTTVRTIRARLGLTSAMAN